MEEEYDAVLAEFVARRYHFQVKETVFDMAEYVQLLQPSPLSDIRRRVC